MHVLGGYFIVFLGAGLGGALRHGVNLAAMRVGSPFPVGTLTVNVAGSLAIGLLAGWFAAKGDPAQAWRLFLITGILGGFTTFSAFSLDVAVLYERGHPATAGLYVLASVVASIGALFAGLFIARSIA
jgi:CrcB protein